MYNPLNTYAVGAPERSFADQGSWDRNDPASAAPSAPLGLGAKEARLYGGYAGEATPPLTPRDSGPAWNDRQGLMTGMRRAADEWTVLDHAPDGVEPSDYTSIDKRAWQGWYTFKDLHEVSRLGLYDPRTTSLPVPGVSSGLLESGMNYDYLPRGTELVAPVPRPSPLQQAVGHSRQQGLEGPYAVGHPARVLGLSSPGTSIYNELIGDIVAIQTFDNYDGSFTEQFTLRCPLERPDLWWDMTWEHPEHSVPVSPAASRAVHDNLQLMMTIFRKDRAARANQLGEDRALPPFIIVEGLPSENLEPVMLGEGYMQPGYHPDVGHVLPTKVAPPIWGPPTAPQHQMRDSRVSGMQQYDAASPWVSAS